MGKKLSKEQLEEQKRLKAEQEKIILDYQKATGHRRPVTRREFLNAGVIQFSGLMTLPHVLDMLVAANPAYAAECGMDVATVQSTAFVTINLNGGWSAVCNWLPRDRGGQLLPSYNTLGSGRTPTTVTAFSNNALFTTNSDQRGFLAGVKQTANAQVMGRTAFIGAPVRSADDTGNNRFDITGLLQAANVRGEKLPFMATQGTPTGINHQAALSRNPTAPLRVANINDIIGAIGVAGSLAALNRAQQVSLAKLISNLSTSQARKLASFSGGQNIANLVECATGKNLENIESGSNNVDPREVPAISNANIWNLQNAGELARAAMVMNSLNGIGGAVSIELGGYDYHGNPRATTDQRDLNVGRLVGQILSTANALQKPVFIYVTSDGSVNFDVSDNAGTAANGDSGGKGANFMIAFNPTAAPQVSGSQLGGFTTGQVADNSVRWGGSPEVNAAAVFANYMKFAGKTAQINAILGNTFSAAELSQVIMF